VPLVADCGQTVCGSDYRTYSCGSTGWAYIGDSCTVDAGVPDVPLGTDGGEIDTAPIDPCATNNGGCDPSTTCTSTPEGVACGPCPSGYTGTGDSTCVDIDECLGAPCQHGGACVNAPGSYTCQCLEGWSGTNCETSVPVELLAAGDIGDCDTATTAAATSWLAGQSPGTTIAVLGDTNQETSGAYSEYLSCFDAPWGLHKPRIRPVPGNHDYMGVGPAGYFEYYGAVAGTPEQSYYSYNLGAWHIIALDDNCATSTVPGGCAAGSAQEQWLRADLAANPSTCTLAYFHQPRYSSGQHGNTTAASPFWQALLDHGAEIVLSGHDHGYERWVAQDNAGGAAANGIVQFVVGTGGTALRSFTSEKPANSVVRDASTHGILKLTLRADGYDWQFVPTEEEGFTDSGSGVCHCQPGYELAGTACVDIDECLTNNGGCDEHTTCTNTPGGRTCGPCPAGYGGTGETGCIAPGVRDELVGRPTDHSITINAIVDGTVEAYVEYGTAPGDYLGSTSPALSVEGIIETVIDGLAADTPYYYRMRYRPSGATTDFLARGEHAFRTQRAAGSTFTFAVKSDSHQGYTSGQFWDEALYQVTMANIGAGQPDFLFDIGDAVSIDDATETETSVRAKYLNQRTSHAIVGHSMPVFLALGNHENEEGWNLDDFGTNVQDSLPVLGANARKRFFLNPVPDGFYGGNTDATVTQIDGDHLKENYYAFTWGDALFAVIDPFWYTMTKPYTGTMGGEKSDETVGNRWDWTLGDQQYGWLKQTLESSTAKFKFVFAHHATGGMDDYIRGGANGAKFCEWGGFNPDGATWAFESRRPGWAMPVHQLLVENGVSAFFHGHDHVYAYERLDGVVYQEVPFSASPAYSTGFSDNVTYYAGAVSGLVNNSGHVRVTVRPAGTPTGVLVEYVRSYLPGGGENGHVEHSYTIAPCEERGDSDGDLADDCSDRCPTNPDKTVPGQCGCGMADTDGDGDGTANCRDGCPSDPYKVSPGLCGCGFDDSLACPLALDGSVSTGTADGVSTMSFAHTTGAGADRLLLVGISANSYNGARTLESVTFTPSGGSPIALSSVGSIENGSGRLAAIYYLLAPPSGVSGTVAVTFSGSVGNGFVAGAANFQGVDQVTPLGQFASATASSTTTISLSVPSNDGDLVFATTFLGAGTPPAVTEGSGQSSLWNSSVDRARGTASTKQASASATSMSWTAGGNGYWAAGGVSIKPSGGI